MRSSPRILEARWLIVLIVLGVGVLAPILYGASELPLLGDNQGQFYIAERTASGIPPHSSGIAAKNQLSFLVNGATIAAGRVLGVPDLWAGRFLSVAVLALSVGLAAQLGGSLGRSRFAGAVAAVSMLSCGGFVYQAAMGFRPKVLLVLFLLLTLSAIRRERYGWAGLWSAASFLCWQPAGLVLLAATASCLIGPGRRRRLGPLITTALAAVLVYEAYFLFAGNLLEQLRQAYLLPFRFMMAYAVGPEANWGQTVLNWSRLAHPLNPSWLLALGGLVVIWIRVLRERRDQDEEGLAEVRAGLFLSLGAIGSLAFTLWDQQGYVDLLFFIPYMSVLAGPGAAALVDLLPRQRIPVARDLLQLFVLLLFGAIAVLLPATYRPPFPLQDQLALSRRVGVLAGEVEGLYCYRAVHVLAFNRTENWTAAWSLYRGVEEYLEYRGGSDASAPWRREGRLPEVMLVTRRLPEMLKRELRAHYRWRRDPEFQRQGLRLYFRRGPGRNAGISRDVL